MNAVDLFAGVGTLAVVVADPHSAKAIVEREHYLHRKPQVSFAYALTRGGIETLGIVTFGMPASRHLQVGVCREHPELVIELNRLWVDDEMPANTESWFVSRALAVLPPRIVVSYADLVQGHAGYVYRALNFHYAGWTDMERKTPRLDYLPADPGTHTRDAFRHGYVATRRRTPKVRYWTTTGNRTERKRLTAMCAWPSLSWSDMPPPILPLVSTP